MSFLIKSNNLYYDASESSYNTSTKMYDGVSDNINNFLLSSTLVLSDLFEDITIDNETFKPIDKFDNFSIISSTNINLVVNGIKSNKELIVMDDDIILDRSQIGLIHNLSLPSLGIIKLVFSFDSGATWETYDNRFIILDTFPPYGKYNEFSNTELLQWETFLTDVQSYGISPTQLSSVNFSTVNFNTIRFAYVINRELYNTESVINKLELSYDELAHLIKVKDSEINIRRYNKNINIISNFNTSFAEIRVLTHEIYDETDEDSRVLLDTPILEAVYENGAVSLSWNSITNADYYKVYVDGNIIAQIPDLNHVYIIQKPGVNVIGIRAYSYNTSGFIQSNFSNLVVIDSGVYLSTADNRYIIITKNGQNYKILAKKS